MFMNATHSDAPCTFTDSDVDRACVSCSTHSDKSLEDFISDSCEHDGPDGEYEPVS